MFVDTIKLTENESGILIERITDEHFEGLLKEHLFFLSVEYDWPSHNPENPTFNL